MIDETKIASLSLSAKKNLLSWWEITQASESIKNQVLEDLDKAPHLVEDAFYRDLEFGTGGLRGVVGYGCNRLNEDTIRMATSGLLRYLKRFFGNETIKVVIGYDSRLHSRLFSEITAKVLSDGGVDAYVFSSVHPTPLVSFACRHLKAHAAIMITASHNPPEYNGYKVYWGDGGQVLPPHDKGIIQCVSEKIIDLSPIKGSIVFMKDEIDNAYEKLLQAQMLCSDNNKKRGKELKIVYSPLHGVGGVFVNRSLKMLGFSDVLNVEEQLEPNGHFPTVLYPNPEEDAALVLGTKKMLSSEADIFLANDPDADRLGVVVRHEGQPIKLTGNQVACLCLEHICSRLVKEKKTYIAIKTIVTTELFAAIAARYGVVCEDVLTGFKYIAQKIESWKGSADKEFVFGAEESYGYLIGSFVRDKDGISACCLISEIALQAKIQGKTLYDLLNDLYQNYGVYREMLTTISFKEGKEGQLQRENLMLKMRAANFDKIGDLKVAYIEDYLKQERRNLLNGRLSQLDLPRSDVIRYWFQDGTKVTVRPSGTEPKVKFYYETKKNLAQGAIEACDAVLKGLHNAIQELFL